MNISYNRLKIIYGVLMSVSTNSTSISPQALSVPRRCDRTPPPSPIGCRRIGEHVEPGDFIAEMKVRVHNPATSPFVRCRNLAVITCCLGCLKNHKDLKSHKAKISRVVNGVGCCCVIPFGLLAVCSLGFTFCADTAEGKSAFCRSLGCRCPESPCLLEIMQGNRVAPAPDHQQMR